MMWIVSTPRARALPEPDLILARYWPTSSTRKSKRPFSAKDFPSPKTNEICCVFSLKVARIICEAKFRPFSSKSKILIAWRCTKGGLSEISGRRGNRSRSEIRSESLQKTFDPLQLALVLLSWIILVSFMDKEYWFYDKWIVLVYFLFLMSIKL